MDCSVPGVTLSVAPPEMLPKTAVMEDEPTAMLVARPLAVIDAIEDCSELQFTEAVISGVVPSE